MLQFIIKYIGFRQTCGSYLARLHIQSGVRIIISHSQYLVVTDLFQRIFAHLLQNALDLLSSIHTFHGNRYQSFLVIAIFFIDLQHLIPQCQTLLLVVSRSLT